MSETTANFSLQVAAGTKTFGKAQLKELFETIGGASRCAIKLTTTTSGSGASAVDTLRGTVEYLDGAEANIVDRAVSAFDGLPIGSSKLSVTAPGASSAKSDGGERRRRRRRRSRSRSRSRSPPRHRSSRREGGDRGHRSSRRRDRSGSRDRDSRSRRRSRSPDGGHDRRRKRRRGFEGAPNASSGTGTNNIPLGGGGGGGESAAQAVDFQAAARAAAAKIAAIAEGINSSSSGGGGGGGRNSFTYRPPPTNRPAYSAYEMLSASERRAQVANFELFVGNLPIVPAPVTSSELSKFIEWAMEKAQLKMNPAAGGQCVATARGSGKAFGFVTFRSREECTAAMNLQGVPMRGRALKLQRLKSWNGVPPRNPGSWQKLMAKIDPAAGSGQNGGGFGGDAVHGSEQSSRSITLPEGKIGVIIGRAGATIKSIQSRTDTRVQIPSENVPGTLNRIVTVYGSEANVYAAVHELKALIEGGAESFAITNQGRLDAALGSALGTAGMAGRGKPEGGVLGRAKVEALEALDAATRAEIALLDTKQSKVSTSLKVSHVLTSEILAEGPAAVEEALLAVREECAQYGGVVKVRHSVGPAAAATGVPGLAALIPGLSDPVIFIQFEERSAAEDAKAVLEKRSFDGRAVKAVFIPDGKVLDDGEFAAFRKAAKKVALEVALQAIEGVVVPGFERRS